MAEAGREEGLDQIPCDLGPDRTAPHAEDVHVVVLHTLTGREMIVDERRANPGYLVRTHRGTDAAPADGDATINGARNDRIRERHHEVRIVVAVGQSMRSEVDDLVSGSPQLCEQ